MDEINDDPKSTVPYSKLLLAVLALLVLEALLLYSLKRSFSSILLVIATRLIAIPTLGFVLGAFIAIIRYKNLNYGERFVASSLIVMILNLSYYVVFEIKEHDRAAKEYPFRMIIQELNSLLC